MGGVEVFVGQFEVMGTSEGRLARGLGGGWRMMGVDAVGQCR